MKHEIKINGCHLADAWGKDMRLIDAEEYKEDIIEAINEQFRKGNMTGAFWLTVADSFLDIQPTIDAVEVIRCKDCMHFRDTCIGRTENGYCSDAKRKEI